MELEGSSGHLIHESPPEIPILGQMNPIDILQTYFPESL
jgi:hypothetical protein